MPCCSVFWCKNRSETSSLQKDNITFHLFPKNDPERWNDWIRACGNHVSWTPKRTSTICSQHFADSCFIIRANKTRRLKQCALPTLKLSEPSQRQSLHNDDKDGEWGDNLPAETKKHMELEINAVTISQPYSNPRTKTYKAVKAMKSRANKQNNKETATQSNAASGARGHTRSKKGTILPMNPNEKAMISHVYKYLKKEKDLLEMVNENNNCDLSILCDILKRTADACGVSQDVVIQILRKNERREEKLRLEQQEMDMSTEWESQTLEEQESYEVLIEEQPHAETLVEVVIETQPEIDTNHDETILPCDENDSRDENSDETVQNSRQENDDTQNDDGSSTIVEPLHIKLEPADIADPFPETTNSDQIQSNITGVKTEPIEMNSVERITAKRRRIDENSSTTIQPLQIKLEPADIADPLAETIKSDQIQVKAEPIGMDSDERH